MSVFKSDEPLPPAPEPPRAAEQPARRARDRKRRGADAVVSVLADAGVRFAFGLPGGAISPFVDALLDEPRVRSIVLRHESTAAFAACGYALMSGGPGVLFTTSGPGALQALNGVASAYADGVPLVVLIGEVPRAVQGRGALQDGSSHGLSLAAMLRPITKATWEATDAHTLPHMVHRALRVASTGRKGPVAVLMPLDVQLASTFEARMVAHVSEAFALDDDVMQDIAARVLKAERPALFVGNGTRDAATAQALVRFVEHTGIPVLTTPKAKGVFPEDHPLSLGVFGSGGHTSALRAVETQMDCLIALGTRFRDLSTDGWRRELYPSRTLIHVDIDGAALARNYAADIGVVAPARLFLDALRAHLPRYSGPARAGGVERQDAALTHVSAAGVVSPARALVELQRALPDNTIFTVDAGEHTQFALHWLTIRHPDAFLVMTGLGSMGSSTGLAIGAALAAPDRRVCAILGDGGFLMVGADIGDAAALGLDLTVAVMNDRALAMCEIGHENVFGRTPSFATPAVDVVTVARGLGATSAHVVDGGPLPALGARGVHVLDVRVDRTVRLEKRDRIAALKDER